MVTPESKQIVEDMERMMRVGAGPLIGADHPKTGEFRGVHLRSTPEEVREHLRREISELKPGEKPSYMGVGFDEFPDDMMRDLATVCAMIYIREAKWWEEHERKLFELLVPPRLCNDVKYPVVNKWFQRVKRQKG